MQTARLTTLFMLVLFLSGCSLWGGGKETPTAASRTTPNEVEVLYVTNRAPARKKSQYYGSDRGETSFGVAHINIPPTHKMGRHEEPSLLKFEWSPKDHKHIKLNRATSLTLDDFYIRLQNALQSSAGQKAMVFVHGYNVDFNEAARVLGQFAVDLKFRGPVILFSWPSQGSLTGYSVDSTNAQWSISHFISMLDSITQQSNIQELYLIAHSMGNRILTEGVIGLAGDRPYTQLSAIKKLIMIAPDIDADVFRKNLAPRIAQTGIHTTLYASSNDRALMASKTFNGYPRAGDAGRGLVIVDGVETIDASSTSKGLLGHSYYAEDRRMMADIFDLLQSGEYADNRFGLGPVDLNGLRYWTFRE